MNSRQLVAFVLAASGIAIGGYVVGSRLGPLKVPPAVTKGAVAPDFQGAVTLDIPPRPKNITDYRGDVVLLNLWATWCGPCEVEMPSIESLHRRLRSKGLRVVGVSVDDPGNEDRIRAFVASHGLTFEILNEGSGRIENDYQTAGIPSTYLIDRQGVIRLKVIGATDWDSPDRRAQVEAVLSEAAGRPVASAAGIPRRSTSDHSERMLASAAGRPAPRVSRATGARGR